MNRTILAAAAAFSIVTGTSAFAATEYNSPGGDPVYAQCLATSLNRYTGGGEQSPIAGQTKVQAFCTCMWNETPDNFKGNLAMYSETPAGTAMNKMCEKHSGWEG
jgi:hypothetical protein